MAKIKDNNPEGAGCNIIFPSVFHEGDNGEHIVIFEGESALNYELHKDFEIAKWIASFVSDYEHLMSDEKFEAVFSEIPRILPGDYLTSIEGVLSYLRSDPKDYSSKIFGFIVNGNIELPFGALKENPPFNDESMRQEFIQRLNQIPGINIKAKSLVGRLIFPLSKIGNEEALTKFCKVIDWCIQEIFKNQD